MNSRSGAMPFWSAVSASMLPATKGWYASALTCSNTGIMVNSVRNSDSVMSTVFGGVSGMPSAWRSIDSTITIRVNDVSAIRNAGASEMTVRPARIFSAVATSAG